LATADEGFVAAGRAESPNFPTTSGAYQVTHATGLNFGPTFPDFPEVGLHDLCVVRFTGAGTVAWSTLLGGQSLELLPRLAVAPNGEVVVKALLAGTDDPNQGAICKLSSGGDHLAHATPIPWDTILPWGGWIDQHRWRCSGRAA